MLTDKIHYRIVTIQQNHRRKMREKSAEKTIAMLITVSTGAAIETIFFSLNRTYILE